MIFVQVIYLENITLPTDLYLGVNTFIVSQPITLS